MVRRWVTAGLVPPNVTLKPQKHDGDRERKSV